MKNEDPDRREKGYILMRTILDYGMGLMILGFGVFFIFAPKFGFVVAGGNTFRYLFGFLCLVYGGWRVFRGFKKNYFH